MAERERRVEIVRGSQRQDKWTEVVDADDDAELRRIRRDWLENVGRIDRALWSRYELTVETDTGGLRRVA